MIKRNSRLRAMPRLLLTGNEAIAIGALDAGCNFYAGYPITPSSEIMHYMANELPQRGGVFIQAEDELAAINMVIGASWAGARAMTATSGPGLSLMQEGLGYAVMTETPLVLVDVMRVGPATGQATKPAQGDLMASRWGRHGDQYIPVLAPQSPQEAYDLIIEAFRISEEIRTPVILLSDEFIGHGREVVYTRDNIVIPSRRKPKNIDDEFFDSRDPKTPPPMPELGEGYYVLVTGSTHNGRGYRDVHSFETHYRLVRRIKEKIWRNMDKLFKYRIYGEESSRKAIVCYGSTCRSAREAWRRLLSKEKILLVELLTVWPINYDFICSLLEDKERIVVPEMNLGQLIYDVMYCVGRTAKVIGVNKVGGGIPIYPSEIIEALT